MEYEAFIGLEVHVQVRTQSKIFTSVGVGFGCEPNTLTDPVVLGFPGALPVLNKEAVEKSIKVGMLLQSTISEVTKWDRKNYFYPDSPKNYQISQFDQPICEGGKVEIELPGPSRNVMGEHKWIELTRAHLEEDVGKLNHFDNDSLVDYNRAGTPLLEIVTEPVLRTPDEAWAYLNALRMLMVYGDISDCDMEKGQMRCDANVSVRPVGQEDLGVKVEIKNMNSISGVRNALVYEIERQIQTLKGGGSLVQETRGWDASKNVTYHMRFKEESHDYRYFPDPDLMPVRIDEDWRGRISATIPERPYDRQRRYYDDFKLPFTITSVLIPDPGLCEFFEEAAEACNKPQQVANWIVNNLLSELGNDGLSLSESKITSAHIAGLVKLIEEGVISKNIAKEEVFGEMFTSGEMPAAIVEAKGLKQSNDTGELEPICQKVIDANPGPVEEILCGNEKAINFLKGQVMKATRGKANPALVDQMLKALIDKKG
ncbi:MAG: Asp-tRNA(Asn)/Glu-tRNA(Gln) amidotransferase GatCAB subunit B [Opitutaceae bacterium]|nr:Asp-tRNA(Asn)/Glu-tRNA(Gln) amidotransferase GatCAB subunit B [Opitutaceae bacterium]|tara:strand:+ start:685 stop:2139 length:1455 start_codon:yes stop_codon:yes gene_type:complete